MSNTSRATSGEYLEALGKKASAIWASSGKKDLTGAVLEVVKEAHLSPEQVQRVVEAANTSAFLSEFSKEGSHKVIDFQGGPADPSSILESLNKGGETVSVKQASVDYSLPPSSPVDASLEEELYAQFKTAGAEYPEVNPLGDVLALREKISGAIEHLTAELSSLEMNYSELLDGMYHQVKQAALGGTSLADVVTALYQVAPSEEHVKCAYSSMQSRLLQDGIFEGPAALVESLTKKASAGVVDTTHPLLTSFVEYCDVLDKLANTRAGRDVLRESFLATDDFVKNGFSVADAARWYHHHAGKVGDVIGEQLGGSQTAKLVGGATGLALKATPYVGGAVLASDLLNEGRYSAPGQFVLRHAPLDTPERAMYLQQVRGY